MRTPGKAWNLVSERSTTPLEGIRRRIDTSASGPAYSMKASSMIQSRSGRAASRDRHSSGVRNSPEGLQGLARNTAEPEGVRQARPADRRVPGI